MQIITNFDYLPLLLNVKHLAEVLRVSLPSAYALSRQSGFPAIRIGTRIVIPKDSFQEWL